MGESDATAIEQIFHITVAQIEALVEPDSVGNYIGWESVAFVGVHGPILAISAR